jgi:putative DNA primase/helicase
VQLIKRLTGNRKIKARFVCRDFFEFARTHKLILVTNNKPVVRESTNAIRRRLRLIPFTVVIPDPEQDKNLLAKLDSERPGILNWLIAGCLAWQRHGLQTPAEVEAATTTFLAEQDPLVDFLVERCLLAANAFVPRTELYALYQAWANKANERFPLDRNAFYERLRTCPGVADAMRRIEGKPTKGFSGIGVAAPTLEEAGFGS